MLILVVVAVFSLSVRGFVLVDYRGHPISGDQEGLLLYYNGTVCGRDFNMTAASAICDLMGYTGAVSWTSGLQWTLQDKYPIALDDVKCSCGDWFCCKYSITRNCKHDKDVFLTCKGIRTTPFTLVSYEIAPQQVNNHASFLLLYNDGLVCSGNSSINTTAANAICKSMGYCGATKTGTINKADNTRPNLKFSLSEISCTEDNWSSCTCNTSAAQECGSGMVVALSCKPKEAECATKTQSKERDSKLMEAMTLEVESLSWEVRYYQAGVVLLITILTILTAQLITKVYPVNCIRKDTQTLDDLRKKLCEIERPKKDIQNQEELEKNLLQLSDENNRKVKKRMSTGKFVNNLDN